MISKYLSLLIISGFIPLIVSFYPPLKFYTHWRALVRSIGLIVIIFGFWDVLAVSRGHWFFAAGGVGGVRIINLPLEEVLFFMVIPFCCIFTWEAFNYIKGKLK